MPSLSLFTPQALFGHQVSYPPPHQEQIEFMPLNAPTSLRADLDELGN